VSILVTGGAGYIGSHCVARLLEAGETVVVLDNLSTGFKKLVLTPDFVEADIHNEGQIEAVLRKFDVQTVMHFAASCYVGESVEKPSLYYWNNVSGTIALLRAMEKAGVEQLIFSSSCATYGVPVDLTQAINEETPQQPVNPYGYSKLMVERIIRDWATEKTLQYMVFRYFNAAGAHHQGHIGECHDPETHLIPLALKVANGELPEINILGADYPTPDGTCIRDYIHVEDIAEAHYLGYRHLKEGKPSDFINLGNGKGYSVQEVVDTVEAVTGQSVRRQIKPRRPGDPPVLIASASKAEQLLGWTPRYPELSSMISSAWQWHQKQTSLV
jgi:UDP-glucose 4-epimerase